MNFRLTKIQLFLIVFMAQTGVIYISFQEGIIVKGGRDAWLMFAVASIFNYLLLLFYEKNYKYFRLGRITSWLYIIYWLTLFICFLAYVQYTLNTWVIQNTSILVTLTAMILVSLYISLSRPTTAINIVGLIIPLMVLFLLFIISSFSQLKLDYLLPIGTSTVPQWMKGLYLSTAAFMGIESFIILRKFVVEGEKIAGKPLFIFHFVVFIYMGSSIVISEATFSLSEIELIPEPIIYILRSLQVSFVKRLDIFFVYIWLAECIICLSLLMFNIRVVYFAKKRKHPKLMIVILHCIILIAAMPLVRYDRINFIREYLGYLYFIFPLLLPIIIVLINKRRDSKCAKESS